jgi:hypothetical protein
MSNSTLATRPAPAPAPAMSGHTSNPQSFELDQILPEALAAHLRQLEKDGETVALVKWERRRFHWHCPSSASRKGSATHAGLVYDQWISIGAACHIGYCTCASTKLCKHLAAAYVLSVGLIRARDRREAEPEPEPEPTAPPRPVAPSPAPTAFCTCGAEIPAIATLCMPCEVAEAHTALFG